MATPDDDLFALRDVLRREEGDLAAFFDAARAEPRDPPDALLDRILADANVVQPSRTVRRRRRWPDFDAFLKPLGGWGAAAALAGCLAAGFLAGASGAGADLAADAIWPDYVSLDAAAEGVDGFFELTPAEG